ncbi:MAG TPA: hypothetical protein VNO32_43285 [Candidatus Acidoferrum sp.]|nr:hypothetical protein [Candidatus Acidoferrum sp.]
MAWQPHDPPKLPDERNKAIAALGYNRFPHLFLELARRFDVPHEFLTVLLYLWDATVGQPQFVNDEKSTRNPQGRISRSQFPAAVRNHQRDKWLTALCASGLFKLLEKAPPESREGSLYEYVTESTAEDWVRFFGMVKLAKAFRGDKDTGGKRESFAIMFRPEALKRWTDEKGKAALPGTKEEK